MISSKLLKYCQHQLATDWYRYSCQLPLCAVMPGDQLLKNLPNTTAWHIVALQQQAAWVSLPLHRIKFGTAVCNTLFNYVLTHHGPCPDEQYHHRLTLINATIRKMRWLGTFDHHEIIFQDSPSIHARNAIEQIREYDDGQQIVDRYIKLITNHLLQMRDAIDPRLIYWLHTISNYNQNSILLTNIKL